MKKFILSLSALLSLAAGAQTVSVADVETLPGKTVTATLNFTAPADTYDGLYFEMQFPVTGFATTGNTNGWAGLVQVGSMNEGLVKITTADSKAFTDVALQVEFTVDNAVTVGVYEVKVANIQFMNNIDKVSVSDVTFKVKVTDRLTLDENATTAPMAQSGVNVKVKRTIKAGEWNTICLPFTMKKADAESVFGSDAKIMTFTGYTAEINEETLIPSAIVLNFSDYPLNNLRPLKAGTPYLIQTSKDIESFDLDGVDIVDATSDVTGTETNYELDGKFCGTLCKTKVPDKGLFISGNKFYYSTGNTDIKAYRGWFNLQAILNEVVSFDAPVYFSFDGETTGIDGVKRETITDDRYYNLKGQQVENPTKGLYIKNGKKVVVK